MGAVATTTKPSLGHIWRNGLIALVVAVIINVILFFVGSALGAFPEDVLTPVGRPIELVGVIALTSIGVIGGTVVYSVLTRFLETGRANMIFTVMAVLVLLIMAFSPFALEGSPVSQIIFLEILHLVAGLSAIYFLTRRPS